jgi:hypothetical protein
VVADTNQASSWRPGVVAGSPVSAALSVRG